MTNCRLGQIVTDLKYIVLFSQVVRRGIIAGTVAHLLLDRRLKVG